MKYTVDPRALDASADAVIRALETLGAVRIDQDLQHLAVAVAGGTTAARIASVTTQWDLQLGSARARLRAHGGALFVATEGYADVESLTARQLGEAGPEVP
ncbi:MAG: hypothetical protein L0H79_04330 [Intrasporangium sp.]|uniref:hypothetical protein n=1 Tax=Intrasporangium sp. TaxID=1925024 RepID=UPI00264849BA|nr:hypothetical protein [Intrasporangium sp.]MDN5794959.1 hypothetical protein [Intrasporangium sp.]